MANNPPPVPLLFTDQQKAQDQIYWHLLQLHQYLTVGEPDSGWDVSVIAENKVLGGASTLADVINVLGTLLLLLEQRGILRQG